MREGERLLGPVPRTADLPRRTRTHPGFVHPNHDVSIKGREEPFEVTAAPGSEKSVDNFSLLVAISVGDLTLRNRIRRVRLQGLLAPRCARTQHCHRSRTIEGKEGNALNEVRVLCNSILENKSVLRADKAIKLKPETSALKPKVGDPIALSEAGFSLLSKAFFDEIERKFV